MRHTYHSLSRRAFLKGAALTAGAFAVGPLARPCLAAATEPAQVFFTEDISPNGLLSLYGRISGGLSGKIGIKLHTGEPNGPNLLPRDLIKALQAKIPGSVIVETNTLYPGPRRHTPGHLETLKINGWDFCPVDIMDAEGDATLPVPGLQDFLRAHAAKPEQQRPYAPGAHLTEVAVGKNLLTYDSLLVYTHFKGHAMGGFGGSLKNISIGCASGNTGKAQIHGEGWPLGPLFLERMVEGGKAVADHFGSRIVYINVLKNISVDCDCDGAGKKPTCRDIGIVASTDLLAVDKASVDLVYALPENELRDIRERIESRGGLHQLEYMQTLGMGNSNYTLLRM